VKWGGSRGSNGLSNKNYPTVVCNNENAGVGEGTNAAVNVNTVPPWSGGLHLWSLDIPALLKSWKKHYTCVGSFTCPGIDAQVQGTTVLSLIRQIVLTTYSSFCMCPGWDRTRSPTLLGLWVKRVNHSTSRPGQVTWPFTRNISRCIFCCVSLGLQFVPVLKSVPSGGRPQPWDMADSRGQLCWPWCHASHDVMPVTAWS
jgi:hypothetical protein